MVFILTAAVHVQSKEIVLASQTDKFSCCHIPKIHKIMRMTPTSQWNKCCTLLTLTPALRYSDRTILQLFCPPSHPSMQSDESKTDFSDCLQIDWQFSNKSDPSLTMSKTNLFLGANQSKIVLKPFGHNATSAINHTHFIHMTVSIMKFHSLTQPQPLSEVNWGLPIGTKPRLYVHQSRDWTSLRIVSNSEATLRRYIVHRC